MADKDHVRSVEQFIEERVAPEYRPIVEAFRSLVKRVAPELTEEMRGGTEAYYGVPAYRLNKIIILISPTKKGVTLAFSEGAKIDDKYGLLEGVGNKALNIRLSSMDDFDPEKITYYIKQAVALDQK